MSNTLIMQKRTNSPNLDIPAAVNPSPYAHDILPTPDTQDCAADLIAGFGELVTNHGQEKVLPVPIGNALLQANDPFATALVRLILPHGADALLEDVIIRYRRQEGGALQVRIDAPEALRGRYRRKSSC